jgi:hypothetical protein
MQKEPSKKISAGKAAIEPTNSNMEEQKKSDSLGERYFVPWIVPVGTVHLNESWLDECNNDG